MTHAETARSPFADATPIGGDRPAAETVLPSLVPDERGFSTVRSASERLIEPLSAEDCCVQSMPDASPAKWHLAHSTWFFDRFILAEHEPGEPRFDDRFDYLFNSYYNAVGARQPRPRRGLLTRPPLDHVLAYRHATDERMRRFIERRGDDARIRNLVLVGLHHEQQHQELMLMDIKHLLSCNPFGEAYADERAPTDDTPMGTADHEPRFVRFEGGGFCTGADPDSGFCFDHETPRHSALVRPFEIADRLVTNAEFAEFIADGGYGRTDLWLDDGWSWVREHGVRHPLYWETAGDPSDGFEVFTLRGMVPTEPDAPVCHVSYFEADAFARWAGARLPTEFEWERACDVSGMRGTLLSEDPLRSPLHPRSASSGGTPIVLREQGPHAASIHQMVGDAWEWTSSAFAAYPGFRPLPGALGEYNGKFMCGQFVLRGGSCLTPASHARLTYRNFFRPDQRWACTGFRLARDA